VAILPLMRLGAAIAVLLIAATPTAAHDSYPPLCCNGTEVDGDCHPIPCDQITETSKGYEWHGFTFNRDQTHLSFNKQCHVCVGRNYWNGEAVGEPKYPHCIFIQPTA
jgi:hypothetical protein